MLTALEQLSDALTPRVYGPFSSVRTPCRVRLIGEYTTGRVWGSPRPR